MTTPTPITVIGLGPMGSALAGAFLAAGHPTTVWNRTAAKADPLIQQGAARAETVAEAASASEVVIVCVLDYRAVRTTLEPAQNALAGRTLINLTSGHAGQTRDLAAWAHSHDIAYLDGAILTPTPSIGTPSAMTFVSGPEYLYRTNEKAIAAIGGTAIYLGPDIGRAAAFDIVLLDFFWSAVNGMAHAFALAIAENIAPHEIIPYATGISKLLPEMLERSAAHLEAGEHPGERSTIASAAAGLDHIIEAATERGIDTGALRASKAIVDRAVAKGFGADGLSRLATLQQDQAV